MNLKDVVESDASDWIHNGECIDISMENRHLHLIYGINTHRTDFNIV